MNDRINYLYNRYCKNQCTAEEWEELMVHLEDEDVFAELIDKSWNGPSNTSESLSAPDLEQLRLNILKHPRVNKRSNLKWYALAAATICGIFLTITYSQLKIAPVTKDTDDAFVRISDVSPGKDKAVFILGNGKQIDLETLKDNEVVDVENVRLRKRKKGWVIVEQNPRSSGPVYADLRENTIRTPRGGEYRVTLPDGSFVILNASSSLGFSNFFSGQERRVALTGEGFFDVKHKERNGKQRVPFIVQTENHDVKVLGTAFNIQAYPNQKQSYTTLVRGLVKIGTRSGRVMDREQILRPGEQATVNAAGLVMVRPVDLEEVTAWKEGYFLFNNQSMTTIMEQVARWYDVDLEYVGKTKQLEFFGIYSRSKSLKSLLENFEKTGKVSFEILYEKKTNNKERRTIIRIKYT